MENATKALLIAAAILIAIVLISIGVFVLNMGRSAVGSVNMNEQEIMAFNSKFTSYEGNIRGSQLNALAQAVMTSNQAQDAENGEQGNFVKMTNNTTTTTTTTTRTTKTDADTLASSWTKQAVGATYKVTLVYYNGIVADIYWKDING